MVAVGQAALLPWCQPTQLLGESAVCANADRVPQAALQLGALAAGQPGCLAFHQAAPGSVPPASAQRGCHLSAVTLAQRLA